MNMLLFAKGGIGAFFNWFISLFVDSQAGFEGGFWANGSALTLILMAIVIGLLLMANRLKAHFTSQTDKGVSGDLSAKSTAAVSTNNRTKYSNVDTFKLSGTFFNLGLAMALGLSVLAFGWSQIDETIYIPEGAMDFEDDIIQEETPRTAEPPPPPPPPPPVIEEVPDEIVVETKKQTSQDADLDKKLAPATMKAAPPPPPPPPPPPVLETNEIFKVVEQMPRFPGCEDKASEAEKKSCAQGELLKFIYKNIKYPAIARENGVEGTAVITFVVETDGTVKDARIVRDIGAQCGDEALRVVQLMNSQGLLWTPGKQRGRNVRVQFNLPVKFRLQ